MFRYAVGINSMVKTVPFILGEMSASYINQLTFLGFHCAPNARGISQLISL